PPQQRLEPDQAAVREGNDRLIMKRQLVTVDGIAKVHLEPDPFQEAFAELLCKYRQPVAFLLGEMHRDIRVAQDLLRRVIFHIARGYSDVDVDGDVVPAEAERLCNVLIDPACDLLRFRRRTKPAKDDGELVSADPGHRVLHIKHADEALRGDRQHLVADSMSECVVYVLE